MFIWKFWTEARNYENFDFEVKIQAMELWNIPISEHYIHKKNSKGGEGRKRRGKNVTLQIARLFFGPEDHLKIF